MKLCFVSQDYPPLTGSGGTGTQTAAKARGLAAAGHEVHVLSHSVDGTRRTAIDDQVLVTRIPGPDHRIEVRSEPVRWLAYSQEVATALDDLHARHGFDLVDFPDYGAEGFTYLLNRTDRSPMATVHLQGPLIMLAHALGWPDLDSELYRVGTHMEATCMRLADAVYSSSALSATWAADSYGLDVGAIPVLHAGIDTEHFSRRDVERDDRPTIVFVGKVGPSKGADVLIAAACRAADRHPGLVVRLFGRSVGGTAEELVRTAELAGHPGLVELAGYCSHADLPGQLSRADIFAAPSPYEGGPGFVYLEAMACALPVIGCSGSGIDEIIVDGTNGHLVPPGDVDALAELLLTLLDDVESARALGDRARQWTLDHGSSEKKVPEIAAFFESLLA